jgi:hypothetical protein
VFVLFEFWELSELPVHFANPICHTNTQGVRMGGLESRTGAYGASIFRNVG